METMLRKEVDKDLGSCHLGNINLSKINPNDLNISKAVIERVSAKFASYYHIIPVMSEDGVLTIAASENLTDELAREIRLVLNVSEKVVFVAADQVEISKAIRKHYGLGAATVEGMVINEVVHDAEPFSHNISDEQFANDASVMRLVNQILADGICADATDIHIEPYENQLRVRFRIDGVLHDAGLPASAYHFIDGIISRIKIMANMDISEKRLAQDGRAQISLEREVYDLRVSVLPTRYGQCLNIRVLPKNAEVLDFCSLGMEARIIDKVRGLIAKPHGIILVTGPTGSGKTTTLYTCMNELNNTSRKIITIEDPVEYDMVGMTQMQVNPDIGFTFASALRSVLRHDPDIILVGEIRDQETAQTAIRTSLTGHLVFSTLHTNSSAAAITRLLDMGIEPYLAASSIDAVLAQRLVRKLCPDCKIPSKPQAEIVTAIKKLSGIERIGDSFEAVGCDQCRFTGYKSRTMVSELLIMTDEIRKMTIQQADSSSIENAAFRNGENMLFQSALKKAQAGITTYEEILRVANL